MHIQSFAGASRARALLSPRLTRRSAIKSALLGLGVSASSALAGEDDNWVTFRASHIAADGRVVDNANRGVSHSEGQGWGLLFAVAFDDREQFERIWSWTKRNLRRQHDSLYAWRFVPTDRTPVRDTNNATDGDIFIAAALARAGRKWAVPEYLLTAAAITRDILALIRPAGEKFVLLPAKQGFERPDGVIVNLSYYAFPFIAELASLVPSPQWQALVSDGRALAEQALFGRLRLPCDWLLLPGNGKPIEPAQGWPPRFGYDAIRVPLWHTWQNLPVGPMRESASRYWASFPDDAFPAWVNVITDEAAPFPASPGIVAVARLTRAAMGDHPPLDLPAVTRTQNYYDAALILLCHMAADALRPR